MSSDMETYRLLKADRDGGIKLLFEQYSKKLLGYAVHNWKTEQDVAWDLIYKTIYKTADVIHEYEFESESKFASFMFKMFINYLRNHFRDSQTALQGMRKVELSDNIINNHKESTKTQKQTPALKILQQELEKLDDWQRILLLMRSQNMSYAEISKYVDRPEDQLKVYYGRLKMQLMEKINKQLNYSNKKENA